MSLPPSGEPTPGQPSLTDGFVATISERLGGPIGRHAAAGRHWWNPARVALLTGTLVYIAGVLFRWPCRDGLDHFKYLCYSDIPLLYPGRGLLEGNTPFLDSGNYPVLEYPVLTGWFLELERILTRAFGGAQGVGLTEEQIADSTWVFMDVNIVLLGALFLIAVWAQVHTPDRAALGRDDVGRLTLRGRRRVDQLGHAADRPDRGRHAGLGPPPSRAGRRPVRPGHGGQALSAVPARPAAAAVHPRPAEVGLHDGAVHVRGQLGSGESARAVAGPGRVAQLLGVQLQPHR